MDKKTKKKLKETFGKFKEGAKDFYEKVDKGIGKLKENQRINDEELKGGLRLFR